MGIVPSCVHSAAKYGEFKRCYLEGMRNLSHFCNQMTPLHHRDIGLVGAGLLEDDVFLEFICDKLHICPDMIALVFKIKGPDRIQLISDAMRASGMPDGEYTLGGLPVIAKDGAARLKEGGALAGSVLQLNVALKNVAEITKLPLAELVKSTSYAQRRRSACRGSANSSRASGRTSCCSTRPGRSGRRSSTEKSVSKRKGGEIFEFSLKSDLTFRRIRLF